MYNKTFQATHPDMMENVSNTQLADRYQASNLFEEGKINLAYTHNERMSIGGAAPGAGSVSLPRHTEPESAKGQPYLVRREMGVFNVGGAEGIVTVDGKDYDIGIKDALYIPMGTEDVSFRAKDKTAPTQFYLVSAPAHKELPVQKITKAQANPVQKGSLEQSNERTIYQYIIPGICKSNTLLVGMTELAPGSVWNTMPPHLHDRRSEIYFYYGLSDEDRVIHFMGQPENMRHIVMHDNEAVISPPWSIHMGCGTSNYKFIWAMSGENLDYTDMNVLDICQLS